MMKKYCMLFILASIILFSSISEAVITWSTQTSMPTARGQHVAVAGNNGLIYAFGGFAGGSEMTIAEAYDPTSNTWGTMASMPTATRGACGAKGSNGNIYVFGGYNSSGSLNATQIYNPTSNTWSTGANMLTDQWECSAATGDNGNIYVFGGESNNMLVQIYNPTSNAWSTGTAMPTGRIGSGAVNINGLIYVIGGMNSSSVALGTVEIYNPTSNAWSTGASMMTPRFEFGIVAGPGNFYAIGGTNGSYLTINEQGTVTGNRIYVLGGSTEYGNNGAPYMNTAESYDLVSNTWSTETNLPVGRRELGAAAFVQSTAIPTMNEWGMIIFAALAGIGSVYYLRKYKRI